MRLLRLLPTLCALLALVPAAAAAQGRGCEIRQMSKYTQTTVGGREIVYIQGPVDLLCDGGVTIRADSATSYQTRREMQLVGNVFYSDGEKSISADWVHRYGLEGRLVARGDVVVRGHESGAVIRGPDLVHEEATAASPARTVVTGRPHATLPPGAAPAAAGADGEEADTLEIDSDWMEMVGETSFLAYGNVVFERGETRGSSRNAVFDQDAGFVRLQGAGRLWGEDFELRGDTVLATLADDELRQVDAWPDGTLDGRDLEVTAPELRIFVSEGDLERLVAIAPPGAGDELRARASAPEFLLVADSIEAIAPAQRLELVTAVGDAYGRRHAERIDLSLPELVRYDWVRGDTIIGEFTTLDAPADTAAALAEAEPAAGGDAEAGEAVLDRLIAIGGAGPASSLFRMTEEDGAEAVERGAQPLSYLLAARITVRFQDGEVGEVDAEGQIRGMHLQPTAGRAPDPDLTVTGSVPR